MKAEINHLMEEPWTEFASSRLENLTEPNPFFEPFSNVDLQPSTELGTLGLRDEAKGDGDSDEDDGISSFEGVRPAWADNESTTKCTGCMLPFVFLRRRRRLIFPSLSELTLSNRSPLPLLWGRILRQVYRDQSFFP